MAERERIYLEQVINLIGDEVGKKYTWFLIGIDAHGKINENLSVDDVSTKTNSTPGYFEASWELIKEMSVKLSAVVVFHLIGSKTKEDFLNEVDLVNQGEKWWNEMICELNFLIEDGEICEITGQDEFLVKRLQRAFSKLPTLLW